MQLAIKLRFHCKFAFVWRSSPVTGHALMSQNCSHLIFVGFQSRSAGRAVKEQRLGRPLHSKCYAPAKRAAAHRCDNPEQSRMPC
jgi:hypothetical protein